jgi:hypothetical protein
MKSHECIWNDIKSHEILQVKHMESHEITQGFIQPPTDLRGKRRSKFNLGLSL